MNSKLQSYPVIQLQKGRERSVQRKHPWVYSGALQKIPKDFLPGSIIAVQDYRGGHLGLGHWCTEGSIVCRLFDFDKEAPTLDTTYWNTKFHRALQLRRTLGLPNSQTNGFRLLYSESDNVPGLICDVFARAAVIQANTHGVLGLLPTLVDFLKNELSIEHIFLQSTLQESAWILGHIPEIEFTENGICMRATLGIGQKTGYFFDQRDNRLLLQQYSQNRTVLDAFCYSGGFTLHALRGQAKQVASLDASKEALALCRQNVLLNQLDKTHETVLSDCFAYLRQMPKDQFDCIVLDPPAFAKKQSHVPKATRGYKDLNLIAMQKIQAGGLLWTFSCSEHISQDLFQKIIFSAANDANRQVQILYQLHQAPDHPINLFHPQSDYLKGLMLWVK